MAVIGVSSSAFFGKKTITSVKFGSTCTYVDKDAFKECISLEEINDNNVIEEIYDGAFASTKLSSLNFSKLKSIIGSTGTSGAFENCSCLTDINIPSCNNIGIKAFANCENLKNVKINNLFNGNTISINASAFYGCGNLKNIDFKNFSRIGNQAFAGCTSIENANLIKCISIGKEAFNGCTKLKEIHLSSCIIGSYAFFNCNNLSKVYINTTPEQSCISLSGDYIFYYNTSQNSGGSPIWPKNLLPQQSTYSIISNIRFYLGADIFDKYANDDPQWSVYKDYMVKLPGDNQILYTTVDNEVINIDKSKYGISSNEYVNNTGSILFENIVTTLNQKIFKNNKEITSIYLPSNCSEVGESEFEGCTSLDSFTPSPLDVLKTIGNCTFKDCTSLKSFTIPESIESLGEGIFAGCSNIEKFEGKFTSYYGKAIVYKNKLISVAPKYNNEINESYYKISDISSNINRLGHYCFSKCDELRRVDIPYSTNNPTEIGDFAFEGCDNLREVHFYGSYPSGSIEFGENAFGIFKKDENGNYIVEENKNDFKIFVPEGSFSTMFDEIDNIENSWIKVYKNYIYPEPSNKYIIYYTNTSQEDNKNYNLIEINSGIIQKKFFGDNKDNISKIIIGEKITEINKNTFSKCKGLKYIYLPNSLTRIGSLVFQECENLKNISIPNNVEVIGSYCFQLSGIKEFNINYGSKLKKISQRTFINCSNLSIVDLSKSKILESIDDYAFAFCENLTDIKLPNTITSIGDSAFAGCNKKLSITLPEGLEKLGDLCLATGSSETIIYIPNSLSIPPIFTISGNVSNSSYPFGDTNPDINYIPKEHIPQIFVPSDFEDIYKNDKYWGKYKDYIKTY